VLSFALGKAESNFFTFTLILLIYIFNEDLEVDERFISHGNVPFR
jgi:hypothetical protein